MPKSQNPFDVLAALFGDMIASVRHEMVERGWFGRQVTDTNPSPAHPDPGARPNNLTQTAVNMTLNSDNAIVQVNHGRASLSAGKPDFDDQWRVKPPSQDQDRDTQSHDLDR